MNKDFIDKSKSKILEKCKKHWRLILVSVVIGFIVANIFSSRFPWEAGSHKGHKIAESSSERKIKYWTCSMHPQIKLPKSGQCPMCAMDLIPVYEGVLDSGEDDSVSITLNKIGRQLAEVETTEVKFQEVSHSVRLVGKVDYDETRLSYISAWVPGRIDRLFVDFTGTKVKKGDSLIKIYSPELLATQEEYLQAIKNLEETKDSRLSVIRDTARTTLTSAREKLRLYGISPKQIDEIVKRDTPDEHMIINSPVKGTVIHKKGFEGMYVKTGDKIYTIADLSRVWLYLDAYESDIQWLHYGQNAAVETESYPGEVFYGKIAFIDPFVSEKTRTIKLRVNVDNKDDRLKPGMFVRTTIKAVLGEGDKVLVIPKTAPLITGKRAIVYVEEPTDTTGVNRYTGKEVVLGPLAGDYYIVLSGVEQGERVVTKGNFKIDSALQIQAKPSMMNPAGYYSEIDSVLTQSADSFVESAGVLRPALPYYLAASKALSEDNVHVAGQNMENFGREIIKIIKSNSLEDKDKGIALEINLLGAKLNTINHDLDSLRSQFSIISEILKEILKKYEYKEDLKLYLGFCSMSFGGKGGYWLQDSDEVKNPYLGPKMLKCGEIKSEYGRKIRKTKPTTGHEGHQM